MRVDINRFATVVWKLDHYGCLQITVQRNVKLNLNRSTNHNRWISLGILDPSNMGTFALCGFRFRVFSSLHSLFKQFLNPLLCGNPFSVAALLIDKPVLPDNFWRNLQWRLKCTVTISHYKLTLQRVL